MERKYDLPRLFDLDEDTGEWVGLPDSDQPVEIGGLPKDHEVRVPTVPESLLKGLPVANIRRIMEGLKNPPFSRLGEVFAEDH